MSWISTSSEFKQVTSSFPPELGGSQGGIQGGYGWTKDNLRQLFASDDPVAFETQDALRKMLRRYFGNHYSDELLFQAFEKQLPKATTVVSD